MKIMISAGEASGDMHAARALSLLKASVSESVEAYGMGGKRLAEAGMELLVDIQQHSVMGFVEVLHKYPKLRGHLTILRKTLKENQPDLLLVVDYPHFNMKLASAAKALDIPVLYYIAPKVWASRPSRIQELKEITDHIAVILPFETKVFDDAGIPNTYVGNPLLDNRELLTARVNDGIPENDISVSGSSVSKSNVSKSNVSESNTIALLPGSRKTEISYLLPIMLDAADKIVSIFPDTVFLIPVAETIEREIIQAETDSHDIIVKLVHSNDYKQVAKCQLALVASGTATLELAIMGLPMIVVYKMNPLSYAVVKRWLLIELISLTNIIAGSKIVPEILQEDATAENIFQEAQRLLTDQNAYQKQKADLERVYQSLGSGGAAEKLCKLIVKFQRVQTERRQSAGAAAS